MAGQAGDICRVSLEGVGNVNIFRNIFFYRLADTGTAGYLSGLLTTFQTTVLVPYAAALVNVYAFTQIVATNIFSGDEVLDATPTPAVGGRTPAGDLLAGFLAGLIVLERQNARVRNGRKYIELSLETDITANQISGGMLTLLGNLATGIAATLNPGGTDTFNPAIVGRIPYTTGSGRTAYRLPASQAEMGDNYSLVSSARVVNRTTTMNSRKYWRGE